MSARPDVKNERHMTIEQQNNIIQTLKEVDGETVQYILQKIGMDSQMLRQLIMTMPLEDIQNEISERIDLEKSLKKVAEKLGS
jgi:hypothetical protein